MKRKIIDLGEAVTSRGTTQPTEEIEYMNSINADEYFAIIPEWVLYAPISATSVRLYCALRRRADKNTFKCHPTRKTLAADIHVGSVATLDRAMKELEDIGAVRVFHRKNGEEYTSNLYTVITRDPSQKLTEVASDLILGSLTDDEQTKVIKPESSNHIKRERSPEIEFLCTYLANAIQARGLKPRPLDEQVESDRWYSEMRLLREGKIGKGDTRENSGELTIEQIKTAIDWAMNDSFWSMNILSPSKLRQQYPVMRMQAQRDTAKSKPKSFNTLQQMMNERKALA